MKKRYVVIPLVIGVIIFFIWPTGNFRGPIPLAPDVATKLGQYFLDDHRAVEIREESGVIKYYEVTSENGFVPKGSSKIISYVSHHIDDIQLSEGWSVSLEKPSTIIIDTGSGDLIKREFGESDAHIPAEVKRRTITRKQMNDRFDSMIEEQPKIVPANEVSPAE